MIGETAKNLQDVELVILPIILNGHFYVVFLDNNKQEYRHYTSCVSEEYVKDATDMVIILLDIPHTCLFLFLSRSSNFEMYIFTAAPIRLLCRHGIWRVSDVIVPTH